jgi:hypothetical protein
VSRYSKAHVRRGRQEAAELSIHIDDSGLVATAHPVHWPSSSTFDFGFLLPLADLELAQEVTIAFARHAVRFARKTARSRFEGFSNLCKGIGQRPDAPRHVTTFRQGDAAAWWTKAVKEYAAQQYQSALKATGVKVALGGTWLVLDELASCGLAVQVAPVAPPKNVHLLKVPRAGLVERSATRRPTTEEKSVLLQHLRSIGVTVEDDEALDFVEVLAGQLTEEERKDPVKASNAYFARNKEFLASLTAAAEAKFLHWQQHYLAGQELLKMADPEVVTAFEEGQLGAKAPWEVFDRFFPKDDARLSTANLLQLVNAKFLGRMPAAHQCDERWRYRYVPLIRRLGGRLYLDAMLALHREAVAAAALLYILDSGANVSTALSLETDFERATSEPNVVEFFAVKARAGYAAIYDAMPVNDPGRAISTVRALRVLKEATEARHRDFPGLGASLFVFTFFHEPSVASGVFLAKQFQYLLKATNLPVGWKLSAIRTAIAVGAALDGTGTLAGLQRKLKHAPTSQRTTEGYALVWPVRKKVELEMAKYQRLVETGVASNVQGALKWLNRSEAEATQLLAEAERTGLGFLCASSKSGARPGTDQGSDCDKVGECFACHVRVFVADEQSLTEVIATNLSLTANMERLESESANRLDDVWIELLAFTTVAIEEAKRSHVAYLLPRATRTAQQWIGNGFDITQLRP